MSIRMKKMDRIQWISINKEVYRRGGIQRYVNWYWYVMQITCTILLPYLFNENPIGLYIMDKTSPSLRL
ncbi:hypothetical protein J4Q44_G00271410 [Coregonus suidteri]|uniref:Uncharacterized protein n=1 Tax=Coregonus suidteri TaxID=861788 RepID=A0AAN8LEM0_9TELE